MSTAIWASVWSSPRYSSGVYGEIQVSDTQGGFIYLNKKNTPLLQRIKSSVGGAVGIKYSSLKESGYLFAEGPEDVKDLIVG